MTFAAPVETGVERPGSLVREAAAQGVVGGGAGAESQVVVARLRVAGMSVDGVITGSGTIAQRLGSEGTARIGAGR